MTAAGPFATRDDPRVVGTVEDGTGPRVLLLHGGPGLSSDYLDGVVTELADGYQVAWYQQRGLAPSRTEGPFTVADHVADARRVLDALGWDTAVVVGHSWGGHLALHVAVSLPERVAAVLAVDPLGGVGDGGGAEFEAEMERRTSRSARPHRRCRRSGCRWSATRRRGPRSTRSCPGSRRRWAEGAGHFPWLERPGCVRAALDRLVQGANRFGGDRHAE